MTVRKIYRTISWDKEKRSRRTIESRQFVIDREKL